MEFELIIAKYLYRHGSINLPGIGIVTLKNGAPDAEYVSRNKNLPVEGLDFQYQPSVPLEPAFVDYFAEQRGKIKSLALSDIESKLQLTRQLLNIGNPYDVPGVGMFIKQNDGSIRLDPGFYINANQEVQNRGYKLRERDQPKPESHSSIDESDEGRRNLKPFIWIISILALLAISWFVYSRFFSEKTDLSENNTPVPVADSIPEVSAPDTISMAGDTNAINTGNATVAATNSLVPIPFKVYIRDINGKAEAMSRFNNTYKRWENKVYMETADSANFKFYVLVTMAPADTAAKRDSLDRFYSTQVNMVPAAQ